MLKTLTVALAVFAAAMDENHGDGIPMPIESCGRNALRVVLTLLGAEHRVPEVVSQLPESNCTSLLEVKEASCRMGLATFSARFHDTAMLPRGVPAVIPLLPSDPARGHFVVIVSTVGIRQVSWIFRERRCLYHLPP